MCQRSRRFNDKHANSEYLKKTRGLITTLYKCALFEFQMMNATCSSSDLFLHTRQVNKQSIPVTKEEKTKKSKRRLTMSQRFGREQIRSSVLTRRIWPRDHVVRSQRENCPKQFWSGNREREVSRPDIISALTEFATRRRLATHRTWYRTLRQSQFLRWIRVFLFFGYTENSEINHWLQVLSTVNYRFARRETEIGNKHNTYGYKKSVRDQKIRKREIYNCVNGNRDTN